VNGDVVARPTSATDDPREVGVVDYVLMGVKAWQVPEAAHAIAPLVGPSTAVFPLQNGVEAPDQIADALGRRHALGGTARIISLCVGPGHIKHIAAEPTLEVGELDGTRSARVEALVQAFQHSKGITAAIPSDIRVAMWTKFLLIASVGGVSAVVRAPAGVLRSVPETRRLLESAMEEIERVARANGISLAQEVVANAMIYVDSLPDRATSSLQRDIAAGKPSEIESLNGAATRLGIEAGVPTPTNTFLYHALLPLERRARGHLEF
jgi:2-dehydropantoate 2-reductase